MRSPLCARRALLALLCLTTAALAQVPDGWCVFGSFQGTAGQNGLFFAHPRDPQAAWIEVTGLPAALAYDPAGRRGVASVVRRSDGALVCGERAPQGTSVDVHVLRLSGNAVTFAQLFSVGTSANVGEIPQLAVLPDGRIVVAATDLAAGGPLAQFQTAQYNWEGIGILDPDSGGVVPIAIPNLNQFPGVINGLAVDPTGTTIYVGNYVSTVAGDVWAVPVAGGLATQLAILPSPPSNLAVDLDGSVLVTALNGPPNLFRIEPQAPFAVTPLATASGPLNAIAVETVTGGRFLATANGGVPVRSLYWMGTDGQEHLLQSPDLATIAALDHNPNPEPYGTGLPGASGYAWQLRPNAGGLPEVGNAGFSLTMDAAQAEPLVSLFVLGLDALAGTVVSGMPVLVDPATVVQTELRVTPGGALTWALPIPVDPALRGLPLRAQALLYELNQSGYAASPGVEFTVL
ncbi:MAG: hypothetical protein AB7O97_22015 [Planctomycetota bacterium]